MKFWLLIETEDLWHFSLKFTLMNCKVSNCSLLPWLFGQHKVKQPTADVNYALHCCGTRNGNCEIAGNLSLRKIFQSLGPVSVLLVLLLHWQEGYTVMAEPNGRESLLLTKQYRQRWTERCLVWIHVAGRGSHCVCRHGDTNDRWSFREVGKQVSIWFVLLFYNYESK